MSEEKPVAQVASQNVFHANEEHNEVDNSSEESTQEIKMSEEVKPVIEAAPVDLTPKAVEEQNKVTKVSEVVDDSLLLKKADIKTENVSEEPKSVGNTSEVIDSLLTRIENSESSIAWIQRTPHNINSDGSDSDSDSSFDLDAPFRDRDAQRTEALNSDEEEHDGKREKAGIRAKGEFTIDDLPPVEALHICVPEEDLVALGAVFQKVEKQLVIQSYSGISPLNLDSVLFRADGTPLGHIFDILGQVSEPFYTVRFNTLDDIQDLNKGDIVYYAPKRQDLSLPVFVADLMKQRGSDASGEHDSELVDQTDEFSDDEQERAAKSRAMHGKRRHHGSESSDQRPFNGRGGRNRGRGNWHNPWRGRGFHPRFNGPPPPYAWSGYPPGPPPMEMGPRPDCSWNNNLGPPMNHPPRFGGVPRFGPPPSGF